MKAPLLPPEQTPVNGEAAELQRRLREVLKDFPVPVQLDALLITYVKVGQENASLEKVGNGLLQLGGAILFNEMLTEVTCNVTSTVHRHSAPAPGEAEFHDAPKTIQ